MLIIGKVSRATPRANVTATGATPLAPPAVPASLFPRSLLTSHPPAPPLTAPRMLPTNPTHPRGCFHALMFLCYCISGGGSVSGGMPSSLETWGGGGGQLDGSRVKPSRKSSSVVLRNGAFSRVAHQQLAPAAFLHLAGKLQRSEWVSRHRAPACVQLWLTLSARSSALAPVCPCSVACDPLPHQSPAPLG